MRAHWMATALVVATLAPGVALADCIHSAFEQDLDQLMAEAETEYPKLGDGRFEALTDQLLEELACLDEAASPQFASRVHRVLGLRARVVDGDDDTARAAFASSRRLDESYSWPEDVIGPRDPERAMYLAVPPEMVVFTEVARPRDGHVLFDGTETLQRPSNVPTYFQRFDAERRVVESRWLHPSDPTPAYPFVRETVAVQVDDKPPVLRVVGTGVSAALIGAGASLLAIGAWDKNNICVTVGADECVLSAKERVVTGGILLGVGVGGFAGSQFLFSAGPDGTGFRWAGRW
ncbi:MAG: hypothetical protein ACI8PZ_006112 [Myxococcota bacterium]|jgi:hypothetical protein